MSPKRDESDSKQNEMAITVENARNDFKLAESEPNLEKKRALLLSASKKFLACADNDALDSQTKAVLVYMALSTIKSVESLIAEDGNRGKLQRKNSNAVNNVGESENDTLLMNNRVILDASRSLTLSGIKNVPTAHPSTSQAVTNDLLILEAKLSELGIYHDTQNAKLNQSRILRQSTTRLNQSISNLGGSYMLLNSTRPTKLVSPTTNLSNLTSNTAANRSNNSGKVNGKHDTSLDGFLGNGRQRGSSSHGSNPYGGSSIPSHRATNGLDDQGGKTAWDALFLASIDLSAASAQQKQLLLGKNSSSVSTSLSTKSNNTSHSSSASSSSSSSSSTGSNDNAGISAWTQGVLNWVVPKGQSKSEKSIRSPPLPPPPDANREGSITWNDQSTVLAHSTIERDSAMNPNIQQLLQTIKRISDENASLLQQVENMHTVERESKACKLEMEKFKKEYNEKFSKLRKSLAEFAQKYPHRENPGNVISGPVTEAKDDNSNVDNGNNTNSAELKARQEQLERILQATLQRLDQAKKDIEKRDKKIVKYEEYYKQLKSKKASLNQTSGSNSPTDEAQANQLSSISQGYDAVDETSLIGNGDGSNNSMSSPTSSSAKAQSTSPRSSQRPLSSTKPPLSAKGSNDIMNPTGWKQRTVHPATSTLQNSLQRSQNMSKNNNLYG